MSVVAGGVLPYNRSYGFLIGRETSDGSFSSFSGFCEDGETALKCAAREFYEETMGLIMDEDTARSVLLETEYYDISVEGDASKYFRLYLLEIPFNRDIENEFRKRYRQLKRLGADPVYLEKDEVKWIRPRILFDAFKGKGRLKMRPSFLRTMNVIYSD